MNYHGGGGCENTYYGHGVRKQPKEKWYYYYDPGSCVEKYYQKYYHPSCYEPENYTDKYSRRSNSGCSNFVAANEPEIKIIVAKVEWKQIDGEDTEAKESEKSCIICLSNVPNCVLSPCMHMGFCIGCANELQKEKTCPICKQEIETPKRLYDP